MKSQKNQDYSSDNDSREYQDYSSDNDSQEVFYCCHCSGPYTDNDKNITTCDGCNRGIHVKCSVRCDECYGCSLGIRVESCIRCQKMCNLDYCQPCFKYRHASKCENYDWPEGKICRLCKKAVPTDNNKLVSCSSCFKKSCQGCSVTCRYCKKIYCNGGQNVCWPRHHSKRCPSKKQC